MTDLGNIIGALMSGLLQARCVADKQTAALAEHYKSNPLLESLSVPRIRIPELTIDMPVLIEDYQEGQSGEIAKSELIASAVSKQVGATLNELGRKEIPRNFSVSFTEELTSQLKSILSTIKIVTKEDVTRVVQKVLLNKLKELESNDIKFNRVEKEKIIKDLRTITEVVCFSRDPVGPKIIANVKTADIKERSTSANVVKLRVIFKEEGLEWSTQLSESEGVIRTLQPE